MLASVGSAMRGGHAMLSTNFVDGAPVWVDLGAPDVARAAEFYGGVFGWKFESAGPDAGGYGRFPQDGKAGAAPGPPPQQGAAPPWTLDFRPPHPPPPVGAGATGGEPGPARPRAGSAR